VTPENLPRSPYAPDFAVAYIRVHARLQGRADAGAECDALIVALVSSSESPVSVFAGNGREAIVSALLLITERETLSSGDLLYCYHAGSYHTGSAVAIAESAHPMAM
jgi:hypothetical protein